MDVLSKDALLAHLKKNGFKAAYQPETDQISVIFEIDNVDYPLFIRVLPQKTALQLLVFIPSRVREATLPATARLLHLLNKEMDLPGFGMDESTNVVFYRLVMPALHNKIDLSLFDTYIGSIQVICRSFTTVIANVSAGILTFEAALLKAKTPSPKPQNKI